MERGDGHDRASAVQAAGSSGAVPLLIDAARRAPLPSGSAAMVIAEYAASERRSSLAPLRAAVHEVRERSGPELPIWVVHTELPGNDVPTLFDELEAGPDSYLRGARDVYASLIERSFYEQVLPAASVTIGWSAWAVQWLSRVPGPIPDHVQVAYSADPAARAAYAAQAADDWRTFLEHRSAELVPGGLLVVLAMALDADGGFGYEPLLTALHSTLDDLVTHGVVRPDEAASMAIPTVARSRSDLLAPFADDGTFHGLRVEVAEVFDGEDRIWADYEASGDAAEYAARWTAFVRASVFPALASSIVGVGVDADARRVAFDDALAEGMTRRLAAAPTAMRLPLARVRLIREA